jgi:hypothetical protein
VREFGDEVLAPQLGRVQPQLARRGLDHPLDDIARLGPPGPAIGIDRHGVGIDRADIAVNVFDVVLARQQRGIKIGRHGAGKQRHVGAEIGDRVDLEGGDPPGLVEPHLGGGDVVAAMGVGHERLRPFGGPLDRAFGLHRRPKAGDLFGIDVDFRAEAAADIGRDHAQLVFGGDVVERRQHQTGDMRVLAGGVKGIVILGRVIGGDRRARLHRIGRQPVVGQRHGGDMGRCRQRRIGRGLVADLPVIDQIARRVVVDLRCARCQRLVGAGDGGQFVIADLDRLGGDPRLGLGFGDHHRDRVADIAHPLGGECRPRPHVHRRSVLRIDRPAADQVADPVLGQFCAGQDRNHALHRAGPCRVHPGDPGMRMRRPDKGRIGLVLHPDIVGVFALAGDETLVFLALDRLADACLAHPASSLIRRPGARPFRRRPGKLP